MASSKGRTPNFSEPERILLAELGKEFPDIEDKGYDGRSLHKKERACSQLLETLSTRTEEDDDGFPEVKLQLGRALRMSQRLHHPVLPRIRREVECFAVVPEHDYLLGFLTLEPPSICTL